MYVHTYIPTVCTCMCALGICTYVSLSHCPSLLLYSRYKSSKKDTLRKRPETDSVFDEIMADLQGDLPSYEAAKQPPTQSPPPEGQKSDTLRRTLGPPVDIDAMSVKGRRRSSSALVANGDGRGIVPVPGVHPRSMSFTSSGSSTALIYPHHHRRSSSQPFSMAPNEPGATALRSLIMLSSNEECLSRLIQYVSLPQFSTRLITLARSARSSCGMLANIATLLQNLYEVCVCACVCMCMCVRVCVCACVL